MCWHLYLSQKPFFFSTISLFNPDILHSYSIIYCFMLTRFNFLESLVTDQFFFLCFGNLVIMCLFFYCIHMQKLSYIFFFCSFLSHITFVLLLILIIIGLCLCQLVFISTCTIIYINCISLFYWLFTLLAYCCCFHLYLYIHKLHVFTRTLLDYYFL